jgi:hypothetical protein
MVKISRLLHHNVAGGRAEQIRIWLLPGDVNQSVDELPLHGIARLLQNKLG